MVDGVRMISKGPASRPFNGIRNNATRKDGATDYGQSRVVITNSLLQPFTTMGGTGIYLNSFHGVVAKTTISSFAQPLHLATWANNAVLDTLYVEINSTPNPAILFGDEGGTGARHVLHGVTV